MGCTHDCSSCSSGCGSKDQESMIKEPHEGTKVKKIIAVVSGKGGVGKSLVTSLMSVLSNRKGYKTAILDADITGPSIPKAFGVNTKAQASESGLFPEVTKTGIKLMSLNLLVQNDTDPVIWRGPVIAGAVTQFWTDVIWDEVDYMFVDMPPGTGDVPLTVFQSIPIDGIIVVTSPQELVSMIVQKAVKMANLMDIPVIGIVENMSYFVCDECKKEHKIFGDSHIEEIADRYGIKNVAKIPIDKKLSAAVDRGMTELFEGDWLDDLSDALDKI